MSSGGSRIWVTGGGGGRGILRPHNLWSLRDHGEGLPSPLLGGSGGMLPREILKIGMRRYAFFTILGYNFRKIRERICKVICTYIYNFYKIFEVTGKIRKIKKKMFNMKKIMHPTVDPATFFLDVYARMSSPLLQIQVYVVVDTDRRSSAFKRPSNIVLRWSDLTNPKADFFYFFFWPARGGGRVPAAPDE